jgi:hypothetical protein
MFSRSTQMNEQTFDKADDAQRESNLLSAGVQSEV